MVPYLANSETVNREAYGRGTPTKGRQGGIYTRRCTSGRLNPGLYTREAIPQGGYTRVYTPGRLYCRRLYPGLYLRVYTMVGIPQVCTQGVPWWVSFRCVPWVYLRVLISEG